MLNFNKFSSGSDAAALGLHLEGHCYEGQWIYNDGAKHKGMAIGC